MVNRKFLWTVFSVAIQLFLNAVYEGKERQVRIIHSYPPSFSSPSHSNLERSTSMHLFVLRHFHRPFYLWSILSGFKKLPNRPQSDQQNRQSLKWYFYKIKPARENTLTLVLIWELLTLYDMGFCSARPTIPTRVLTIYMKTPEIPAGKSHSPRHSVWEASEIWAAIWVKSGSFSIDDGNCSENISFKMNSRFSNTVAFIPICWKWQM